MRSQVGKPMLGTPSFRAPEWCGSAAAQLFLFRANARLCCRNCMWCVVPGSLQIEEPPMDVIVSCEKRVACEAAVVPVLCEEMDMPSIQSARVLPSSSPLRLARRPFRFLCSKTSIGFAPAPSVGALAEEDMSPLGVSRGGPFSGSSNAAACAALWLASAAAAAAIISASSCLWRSAREGAFGPPPRSSNALYSVLTLRRKRFCSWRGRVPCHLVTFCRSSLRRLLKKASREGTCAGGRRTGVPQALSATGGRAGVEDCLGSGGTVRAAFAAFEAPSSITASSTARGAVPSPPILQRPVCASEGYSGQAT
mmetsp:Transcript_94/g.240  ORF Transcript_94/g.240 Transcript_94/m.240 type:complete len:310 (-) Transcript_94:2-931(-)